MTHKAICSLALVWLAVGGFAGCGGASHDGGVTGGDDDHATDGGNPGDAGSGSATCGLPQGPTIKTTYYVATTGDDSNSCDQATHEATPKRSFMGAGGVIACMTTPGDRVLVREGTYDEQITNLDQQLPSGTSWQDAFTVAAYPNERVVLTRGIGFGDCCQNEPLPQLSYWIFDGFHLISNDRNNNGLIYNGDHVDHVRFINLEVTNNDANTGDPGPTDWSNSMGNTTGNCISGRGQFLEFINLEIHHCGAYGAYYNGQDTVFDHITMHDVHGYGFHLYHYSPADVHRNTVRNSTFYNIMPVTPSGVYPGLAILLARGDGNAAYNNVVYDSGQGIASGNGATNSLIFNNTVYNCSGVGIAVGGASNVTVENNISWGNTVDFDNCGEECDSAGNVFANNLCSNDNHIYHSVGCTIGDPMFIDPAAHDFHLRACSPAIDEGSTLPVVAADAECVSRPQFASFDLGAYESTDDQSGCR